MAKRLSSREETLRTEHQNLRVLMVMGDLSRPEVTKSSSSRSSALRTDSSSWVDFTGALHGQAPQ